MVMSGKASEEWATTDAYEARRIRALEGDETGAGGEALRRGGAATLSRRGILILFGSKDCRDDVRDAHRASPVTTGLSFVHCLILFIC